eukprot:TRINITY_DN39496_c0_g1_i1.p1 TRINITY_DN39496_c0_g1~~TRINITY_DN39496_c0_g1_i1.p1  ORF type:complete len:393 (+),score=119.20 TRINITY_DN39496_c0_g1_i1:82-1179(+)
MAAAASDKNRNHSEIASKTGHVASNMEGWVDGYRKLCDTVEDNGMTLARMDKAVKTLEHQVKAMANVMANSNLHKLHEDRAAALDAMRAEIDKALDDQKEALHRSFAKDVENMVSRRCELSKRVDSIEEKLTESIAMRFEEAKNHRNKLENQIERFHLQVEGLEKMVPAECLKVKDFASNLNQEQKKALRSLQAYIDEEKAQRERAIMGKRGESERIVEQMRAKQEQTLAETRKQFENIESTLMDKARNIENDLGKLENQSADLCKYMEAEHRDLRERINSDMQSGLRHFEMEMDRKFQSCQRLVHDLKLALESERNNRSSDVEEVKREIQHEKKQRDIDEHKMLAAIKSMLGTFDKMHEKEEAH